MKVRIALFFLLLFSMTACSQYTCPTYSKDDVKEEIREDQNI